MPNDKVWWYAVRCIQSHLYTVEITLQDGSVRAFFKYEYDAINKFSWVEIPLYTKEPTT